MAKKKDELIIYEAKTYVVNTGDDIVTEFLTLDGEPVHYRGTSSFETPAGDRTYQFPFPSDFTLRKCFEKFDVYADKAFQELQARYQKQLTEKKIITPKGNNGQIII